ncbi:MAG: inorganic diphosphatase [Thermoplasmataceae archaeon]
MAENGSYWHSVPVGPDPPEVFYTVVETPKGSKNKYEIAKEFPGIVLDRVLHSSVVYPTDYGLIPKTLYYDNDPMDVLLLISQPTFPGTIVASRPIAIMKMLDKGEVDNKILAVAKDDPYYKNVQKLDDLPKHLADEIVEFFTTYKRLENKKTEVTGWGDKAMAVKEILESIDMYNKKYGKK